MQLLPVIKGQKSAESVRLFFIYQIKRTTFTNDSMTTPFFEVVHEIWEQV